MILYLIALTLFLLIMLLMSIGIIFHRPPMQNRCRSLSNLGFYPLSCQYLYGPSIKGQDFNSRSINSQCAALDSASRASTHSAQSPKQRKPKP